MNRELFKQQLENASPVIQSDDIDACIGNALLTESGSLDSTTRMKIIATQECSELIKEITDDMRGKPDPTGILEEMADIFIVLNTLQTIYGITDELLAKAVNVKVANINHKIEECGKFI